MTPNRHALAIVTGGAQRIGREISLRLGEMGFWVGIHYFHSEKEALETVALIRQNGGEAFTWQADLREPDQIAEFIEEVAKINIPLTVFINAAAVMPKGDLMDAPLEQWDEVMTLNTRAVWLCTRAAATCMQAGVIINIIDAGLGKIWLQHPLYQVSKESAWVLTRQFARRLAPNIRVNAIAPGLILPGESSDSMAWQKMTDRLPLGHSGTPRDVADAVAYLIDAQYVTGQMLVVDGGYQLV